MNDHSSTINPSSFQIEHRKEFGTTILRKPKQQQEFLKFVISGKFKGAKINLKAHQQKLQLKTKYQNKISHNQKNKTFKGELGLLQSIGWDDQYQATEYLERQQLFRQDRRILTSQRQRLKGDSSRKIPKTADQSGTRHKTKRNEVNLQNIMTTALPAKQNYKTISYFYSQNLKPQTNQTMNLTIRNTINLNPPQIPKKEEKVQEKMFFSVKKLRSKVKSRSCKSSKRNEQKKIESPKKVNSKQFQHSLEGPSPLIDKLIHLRQFPRKIQRHQVNGYSFISLNN